VDPAHPSMRRGADPGPPRVLFHFSGDSSLQERLRPYLAGLDVVWCGEDDDTGLDALLGAVDVWWHVLRPITAWQIARASGRLRLIQKLGSGVDTIDLSAARAHGVHVANMVGMNAQAVAESALGLILAVLRRTVVLDAETRCGRGWLLDRSMLAGTSEISGSTVGLVGYGRIARKLRTALDALGAEVIHTSSAPTDDPGWREVDDLISTSDIISLHAPLTSRTRGMIDRRRINLMRPGAIVINTARGALVDEVALAEALLSGRLGGAGLDVFSSEPIAEGSPLLTASNVVLSPHVGWLTFPALVRSVRFAVQNVRRLVSGDPIQSLVSTAAAPRGIPSRQQPGKTLDNPEF
jgi:phosphoglycerate dehydrogenase-like enzyme